MVLCLAIVAGYRDTDMIGNAYGTILSAFSLNPLFSLRLTHIQLQLFAILVLGLAVITVMLVTSCLMFLVIVIVWKRNILGALAFVIVFGSLELFYFSACLAKVHKGVPKVPANQGFVISRIGPPEFHLFQCVVRYDYKDQMKDSRDFENHLIETMAEFLQCGSNDSELRAFGRELALNQLLQL
ncbi:hypothetical protein REPUB_Repub18cG0011000 [Reevesia pubescens]